MNVEVVARGGQQQHRAGDLATGGPVGFLVRAIDVRARAVVLAHAVHDGGIV
jgi:hypothetical protein